MKKYLIALFALALIPLTGCAAKKGNIMDGDDMVRKFVYTQITQDEAKRMMQDKPDCVIVDVRRQDEYDSGHIPGAICIPNETIGDGKPEELPDMAQVILVYCRSGNRSKQAAQKLADMGYSNVYEFGGIIDWTGDIEK